MAIKEPLMFITVDEFKNSKYFNELLFDKVTTPDNEIWFAISVASSNIDYLSGFTISKKWPEINPTVFTDNVQTATTHYVRFLLTKDVDYLRGQGSISQGGLTYSETNPDDPYFIPPEVFNYLRNIKEYIAFKGFDIDVAPKNNYYQTYFGNGGHNNLLELYLVITNLFSSDPRVKIKQIHKPNIQGTFVDIDTTGIKTDIDNLLWEVDKDNPNFVQPKDDKGIDANGKRIIDVGTPTFLTDATTKQYVDDKWLEDFSIDFKTNANYNEIENLQTEAKQIIPAINENKENIDKKQGKRSKNLITTAKTIVKAINEVVVRLNNIPQWKEVAITNDLLTINYVLKDKTHYRIYYNQYNVAGHEIGKNASVISHFYYQIDDKPFPITNFEYNNNIFRAKEGHLWKLEELQDNSSNYEIISNTLQIISPSNIECNKPLIIKSNSLNTNNPIENTWQIELKNNSKWKKVGIKEKNKWDNWQITYDFIENKRYRMYYTWNIYNKVYAIQEFTITDARIAGVPIEVFNDGDNILVLSVNHGQFITIYSLKGSDKGDLWKLEELQG